MGLTPTTGRLVALLAAMALTSCGRLGGTGMNLFGFSAPVYVQGKATNYTTAAPVFTATFDSSNSAGNLIIVFCSTWYSSVSVTSVSDSQSNTYRLAIASPSSGIGYDAIYYASNAIGGALNIVTCHLSTGSEGAVTALEYSGAAATDPLDTTGYNVVTSGTSVSASLTTRVGNELVVGTVSDQSGTLTGPLPPAVVRASSPQFSAELIATTPGQVVMTYADSTQNGIAVTLAAFLPRGAAP